MRSHCANQQAILIKIYLALLFLVNVPEQCRMRLAAVIYCHTWAWVVELPRALWKTILGYKCKIVKSLILTIKMCFINTKRSGTNLHLFKSQGIVHICTEKNWFLGLWWRLCYHNTVVMWCYHTGELIIASSASGEPQASDDSWESPRLFHKELSRPTSRTAMNSNC